MSHSLHKIVGPGGGSGEIPVRPSAFALSTVLPSVAKLQSFKDSVSLPEVIGMEGWEQMAASTQCKSHDGGDEEETWKPFQFSFIHTDYELFCVEMMDRRNLKVFASFESNTSPPPRPRPPPCDACATRLQCSLMMQHNGGAWQLWRR
ncbi:unnamed protein product [Boreogadus saida]